MSRPVKLTVWAPDGAPEVAEGDDLAAILVALLGTTDPRTGCSTGTSSP